MALVVARYNENIEWTEEFTVKYIYNKGDKATLSKNLVNDVIDLPNVGREAHTYLYHIIKNYDKLDEITIFTQGKYNDHYTGNNFKDYFSNIDKFSRNFIDSRIWGLSMRSYNFSLKKWDGYELTNNHLIYGPWYENIFNTKYINNTLVYVGAIFSIRKDLILARPLSFYEKLIKEVEHSNSNIEVHFIERSWLEIFQIDKLLANNIPIHYLWSPKYKIFADILNKSIEKHENFTSNPHFIEQHFFNKIRPDAGNFLGCTLKLNKAYELLCTLPENSYFIFCDADIHIFKDKPFYELIQMYIKMDADIVCMKDNISSLVYNCGFILLKVNELNRRFYKEILDTFLNIPESDEQYEFNKNIKNYDGYIYYFPFDIVITTSTLIEFEENLMNNKLNSAIVFQPLVSGICETSVIIKLLQYGRFDIDMEYFHSNVFSSPESTITFLENYQGV